MSLKEKRDGKAVEKQKNKNFNTYRGLWPELNSKIKMPDRTQSGFPPLRGNDKYGIPAEWQVSDRIYEIYSVFFPPCLSC